MSFSPSTRCVYVNTLVNTREYRFKFLRPLNGRVKDHGDSSKFVGLRTSLGERHLGTRVRDKYQLSPLEDQRRVDRIPPYFPAVEVVAPCVGGERLRAAITVKGVGRSTVVVPRALDDRQGSLVKFRYSTRYTSERVRFDPGPAELRWKFRTIRRRHPEGAEGIEDFWGRKKFVSVQYDYFG